MPCLSIQEMTSGLRDQIYLVLRPITPAADGTQLGGWWRMRRRASRFLRLFAPSRALPRLLTEANDSTQHPYNEAVIGAGKKLITVCIHKRADANNIIENQVHMYRNSTGPEPRHVLSSSRTLLMVLSRQLGRTIASGAWDHSKLSADQPYRLANLRAFLCHNG